MSCAVLSILNIIFGWGIGAFKVQIGVHHGATLSRFVKNTTRPRAKARRPPVEQWPPREPSIQSNGKSFQQLSNDEALSDWPGHSEFWLQYARVAFCDIRNIIDWSCGEMCASGMLKDGGIVRAHIGETWGAQFYVAQLPDNIPRLHDHIGHTPDSPDACVAAFRGTVSAVNIHADTRYSLVPYDAEIVQTYCGACNVHQGFRDAFLDIVEMLEVFIQELGCRSIHMVGHSFGAAMATFATLHVRSKRSFGNLERVLEVPPAWLYGSPRVGDENFRNVFGSCIAKGEWPGSVRVVMGRDIVARIPPVGKNYRHVGPELWKPMDGAVLSDDRTSENCDGQDYCFCSEEGDEVGYPWCASSKGIMICAMNVASFNNHHLTYHDQTMVVKKMPEGCTVFTQRVQTNDSGLLNPMPKN